MAQLFLDEGENVEHAFARGPLLACRAGGAA
jgi:hypothetical protein